MNIQKSEPLRARRVFELRPYIHFGAGGGVFLLLLIILIFFINPLIAVLIAGGLGYAVYFYLESRLLVIACPRCGKDINTNTPWECGFQGCKNLNVDEFPFVRECEHCHYIPKAYMCHHAGCNKPIFLTTDRQEMHAARRLENLELPVKIVVIDPTKDKALMQKDQIGDLEHELGVETLRKKIEIVKKMPTEASATKTPEQILDDEITMEVNQGMALMDIEQRHKAKADIEFANDEHKRAQKHAWIEKSIGKRIE